MRQRREIYQAKIELCRQQAQSSNDDGQRARWLKLADQWSKMAQEIQQPLRKRVNRPARAKVPSYARDTRTLKTPLNGPSPPFVARGL